MPLEALNRPKQGFALPLVHWMRNELKEVLMILLEPRTLQRGYFEAEGIRKLMNDHLYGGKDLTRAHLALADVRIVAQEFPGEIHQACGTILTSARGRIREAVAARFLLLAMATAPAGE